MRCVTWVSWAPISRDPDGRLSSDVASARYRILAPAKALRAKLWETQVLVVPHCGESCASVDAMSGADVVVFSKSFREIHRELASQVRAAGRKTVLDVCDNYFDHPKLGDQCRRMADLVDLVVCNSKAMADVVLQCAGVRCCIIGDPVEGPVGPPRFEPGERLKVLWFGYPGNLRSLGRAMESLVRFSDRHLLHLTIMTSVDARLLAYAARISVETFGRLEVSCDPWSIEAQWRALESTDVVIIPVETSQRTIVKSANRLIETVRAGRMAIVGHLPAYEVFGEWVWIGSDMGAGLEWALMNRGVVSGRIGAAQQYIEAHFEGAIVGEQWNRALSSVLRK